MAKVKIRDKRVVSKFLEISSALSATLSAILIFVDIPDRGRIAFGVAFIALLIAIYVVIWFRSNQLRDVSLSIDGSVVNIKVGDIFLQPGFKAIAFNEFLDTQVDDKIIAHESLNGAFIKSHLDISVAALDLHIETYEFDEDEMLERDANRKVGKSVRYKSGTICVYGDYLLTAFAKFDESNIASLTMPEYLEFLINFWNKVNRVYAQKSVSTPIFGSGITRIRGHKDIGDEDLLKIMLWTFRISEMRFKYPAKLTIVIHEKKIDQINLFEIKSAGNGM